MEAGAMQCERWGHGNSGYINSWCLCALWGIDTVVEVLAILHQNLAIYLLIIK